MESNRRFQYRMPWPLAASLVVVAAITGLRLAEGPDAGLSVLTMGIAIAVVVALGLNDVVGRNGPRPGARVSRVMQFFLLNWRSLTRRGTGVVLATFLGFALWSDVIHHAFERSHGGVPYGLLALVPVVSLIHAVFDRRWSWYLAAGSAGAIIIAYNLGCVRHDMGKWGVGGLGPGLAFLFAVYGLVALLETVPLAIMGLPSARGRLPESPTRRPDA